MIVRLIKQSLDGLVYLSYNDKPLPRLFTPGSVDPCEPSNGRQRKLQRFKLRLLRQPNWNYVIGEVDNFLD